MLYYKYSIYTNMRVFVIHQHTLKCPPVLGSLCCPVTSCQWIHHQNWIRTRMGETGSTSRMGESRVRILGFWHPKLDSLMK